MHLAQPGRDDSVVALSPAAVQQDPAQYGDLIVAARVLMSAPAMLKHYAAEEGAPAEHRRNFERCVAPALLQLARYPESAGRYVAHLDNDPGDPGNEVGPKGLRASDRIFTCILYLNEGWAPSDEGCLRMYRPESPGDDGDAYEDIAPKGGRLVIFDSRSMLHEVRPSFATRWAISAWLCG